MEENLYRQETLFERTWTTACLRFVVHQLFSTACSPIARVASLLVREYGTEENLYCQETHLDYDLFEICRLRIVCRSLSCL